MDVTGKRVPILVESATLARMDRMIAEHGGTHAGALNDYDAVLDYALDLALSEVSPTQFASVMTEANHHAATLGPLALIDVDGYYATALHGALDGAQGTVLYTPTYGTAIGWLLDAAALATAGHGRT